MKKLGILSFIFLAALLSRVESYAQDTQIDNHTVTLTIPEVALLDLESSGSKNITIAATAPTEAGNAIDFTSATNSTLWLNYSSIKKTGTDPTRKVTAKLSAGTVPAGTLLKVVAAADAAAGDGTVGTSASIITLTSTDQDFITAIGSAYTGTGVSKGHNLTYSLSLNPTLGSYALLDANNSTTVTVVYTLSDN